MYYLIENLEDLGDEFKKLGAILAETKFDKEIYEVIAKMNELLRISYEFFYTPKKDKAVKAFILYQQVKKEIESLYGNKNQQLTTALVCLDLSIRIIYHITTMRLDTLKELSGD